MTPELVDRVDGGRYRFEAVIASGGQGTVVEATERGTNASVAIKFLHDVDETAYARFEREAEILAKLESPHVVRVIAFGRAGPDGPPFLVMPKLQGITLHGWLARRRENYAAALFGFIVQVCEALEEVHGRGVVHRDLKPSNVFLERTPQGLGARLLDFGIARDALSQAKLTRTADTLGTPSYMAPEQLVDPQSVDARADVFAAGVILYEGLTGRRPFEGRELDGLARSMQTAPIAVETLAPDVPAEVARVIMACLSVDPRHRPASARALAEVLRPHIESAAPRTLEMPRRRPRRALFGAAVAVTLLLGGGLVALTPRPGPRAVLRPFTYAGLPLPSPPEPMAPSSAPSSAGSALPPPPTVTSLPVPRGAEHVRIFVQSWFGLSDGEAAERWFRSTRGALEACQATSPCKNGFFLWVSASEGASTFGCDLPEAARACLTRAATRAPSFAQDCLPYADECVVSVRFMPR